jgi:signal peptidase II
MRRVAVALIALMVILFDRVSKAWVLGEVRPGTEIQVVDSLVRFVHSENRGGLFGLLQGSAVLLVPLSAGVVIALYVAHEREAARRPTLLTLGIGALIGGAIGNAIDRITLGYVLDFVDLGVGTIRFWTFNVADMGITAGIVVLAVDVLHLNEFFRRTVESDHE